MLVHCSVYCSIQLTGTYFVHLGGEAHCESKGPCPSPRVVEQNKSFYFFWKRTKEFPTEGFHTYWRS